MRGEGAGSPAGFLRLLMLAQQAHVDAQCRVGSQRRICLRRSRVCCNPQNHQPRQAPTQAAVSKNTSVIELMVRAHISLDEVINPVEAGKADGN
jgi:hypothetical protein